MNNLRRPTLLIGISLILIACCLILLNMPRIGMSQGLPQGSCSVKALLLNVSAFPSGTTMSSSENFEDFAVDTASHSFGNLVGGFSANHAVEYYNSPFSAWQTYMYNYGIFKKSKYNDSWTKPNEVEFSSQIADQYHFACTNDTVIGYHCILTARYGRYYVFFGADLSQRFTVKMLNRYYEKLILACHLVFINDPQPRLH